MPGHNMVNEVFWARMRRRKLGVLADFAGAKIGVSVLFFALSCTPLAFANPKIFAPEAHLDFGKRLSSTPVEHDFIIKNIGDSLLILDGFINPCGCTGTSILDDTLEPGEETTVHVQIRPMGAGRVERTVSVTSNDPEMRALPLHFIGEFIPEIVIEPNTIFLSLVEDDSRFETPILLYAGMETVTFSILGEIECSVPWLDVEIETITPGKSYKLKPKILSRPPSGTVTVNFVVHTDHPDAPEVYASITGTVIGDYTVLPDRIRYVYDATSSESGEFEFSVMKGRLGDFQVIEVISPSESLEVEMSTNEDKSIYRFKVRGIAKNQVTLSGKEIILKTNLSTPVRIPIEAIK